MVNQIGRIVYGSGDEVSTQNYETSVPNIFKPKAPIISKLEGMPDLEARCLNIFIKSAVAIDAKLGYRRQA